ncbi:uroporphyrinogen decarboxylase family protein [uncultured Bacteroides sp.]|uniref:uroporphyrinogen decarboxylase family protein n=1 Tax=uncultured Bacteroides sp. TaxID=162156 RepID=UPI0026050C5D|nr:uroporphyrinogen decarboxylase family protein [uncultured Bacteroides sp.]
MNSRERVLAAIAHKEPDKVPVDMGATPSSGISAIAYSNLLKAMGRDDLPVWIYDVVQQLAQPDMSIIDHFGIDVIDVGRAFNTMPADWHETELANGDKAFYPVSFNPVRQEDGSYNCLDDDGVRILARMPKGATFFDQTYFPYVDGFPSDYSSLDKEMGKVLWSRYVHSPWDHSSDPDFWKTLREKTLQLRETTDKALMIVCGCNLFEWGTFLRRMDNFLMDLLCEPDEVAKMLDQLLERHLATLEKVCASVGDIVDIIRFGDDLGMTTGPFMDVDTYKTLFKPRHKQLCDYVKSHSNMHTFIHSCGSISSLMPDMIDAGIEIFNPVQTNAFNMEPEFLKKEFGKDCTFWGGGVETVGTLNNGSPEEVRRQVLERLEIMSAGGGFVFNTVHNILPDVPPQNIIAMFDAVKEFNNRK